MKRKSILRDRPGVFWLLGLAILGLVVAYVIGASIHGAEKSVRVYVAATTIPDDSLITANELTSVNISASVVPAGVIVDSQAITGKYTDATIAKGEPILASDVAPASTVRELIRTYGMNFVGATVQLQPSDLPITDVRPGDLVDLAGVYGVQNQQIYTQWIATGVPVLSVDTTNAKIVLAIPQTDALNLIRDLTVGKVRVLLDPNPFQGAVTFATNQSSQSSALQGLGSQSTSGINPTGAVRSGAGTSSTQSVLPPGKNALANAKQLKTVVSSTATSSK